MFVRKMSYTDENGDSYEVFSFPAGDDAVVDITVPSRYLINPSKIYDEMLNKGLNHVEYPPIPQGLTEAVYAEPLLRSMMMNRLGWVGSNFEAFASSSGIVGTEQRNDGRSWLINSNLLSAELSDQKEESIGDWFENCSVSSVDSTSAIIILSAAFAAPLLKIISEPAFGIAFYGGSKLEADTITLLAGSITGANRGPNALNIGYGQTHLPNFQWRFGDQLVPIRLGDISDLQKYIHMVSNFVTFYSGVSKDKRNQILPVGEDPRLIAAMVTSMSKAEISAVFEKIFEIGHSPRIISASIVDGESNFYSLYGSRSSKSHNLSRINALRRAAEQSTAHPIREFAKFLIESRVGLRERVEKLISEFQSSTSPGNFEDESKFSSSRCFGLLYAAAILAGEARLLWQDPSAEGRETTKMLFVKAHRENAALWGASVKPAKDMLIEILREWELDGLLMAYDPTEEVDSFSANGGYWIEEGKFRVYTIHQNPFRAQLGDRRLKLILEFLKNKNAIKTGVQPNGNIFHDCGSTPRWPDGETKVKSFVFRVPRKLLQS